MPHNEAFEKILKSFARYYDVSTENVCRPFSAFAEFHSHQEQYFLVKAAKLSELNSNEYAYFYKSEDEGISFPRLQELTDIAWKDGLSRVRVDSTHHCSDITLVVIGSFQEEALKRVKKIRRFKSYCFGFKGFSRLRLCVFDVKLNKTVCNSFGSGLEKLI